MALAGFQAEPGNLWIVLIMASGQTMKITSIPPVFQPIPTGMPVLNLRREMGRRRTSFGMS